MSKRMLALILTLASFGSGLTAFAQDKQEKPAKEEAELTIEEAMKMLKECGKLMESAEDLLNDASRGKALETEKELMEKIDKLLKEEPKENPAEAQKKVLEKIQKLMQKSEKSQGDSADKLGEVIRRVKAAQGQGQGQPGQPQQPQQPKPQSGKPDQPQNPADKPYDPNRNGEPINKFRSKGERTGRWGDLPARLREAMLSSKRLSDDFPAEYQQVLKEYMKRLADEKD
jgi:ATP-dependent exoDNAse (exonuclease V) beta subunit